MDENKVVELKDDEIGDAAGGFGRFYEVKSGDSLWSIAHRFGTTVNELARINQLKNPDLIRVGQVIKLY